MSVIADETLMAYVDGELDAAARTKVEAYLAASPEGRERLEIFQSTGRGLSELFEQPMREPVPQRLLDAVTSSSNVVSLGSPRRRVAAKPNTFWPAALAASLTVLAAGGSAYWYAQKSGEEIGRNFGVEVAADGRRVASPPLASVLDSAAQDDKVNRVIGGHQASIKPVFTFATADKSYCRQYVIKGEATAYGGVACKASDGQWQVEAHDAFAPAPEKKTGEIAPAGGNDGPPDVEAAVDRLIDGDVLSTDAEAKVMANGWRAAP